MLLVCVDCLFPLHDVLTLTEKKSMGSQRVTLSLAQPKLNGDTGKRSDFLIGLQR